MTPEYKEVFAEVFAGMKCDNPDCDCGGENEEMFIHSQCHTGELIEVFLKSGYLYIRCRTCESPILKMQVPAKEVE